VIVKIEEAVPAGANVTLVGFRLVVNWEKLKRETRPENPFRLVRSIFAVSDALCASVR
jgi:hypothetical protein